mgnify:CR=1 FL=1
MLIVVDPHPADESSSADETEVKLPHEGSTDVHSTAANLHTSDASSVNTSGKLASTAAIVEGSEGTRHSVSEPPACAAQSNATEEGE